MIKIHNSYFPNWYKSYLKILSSRERKNIYIHTPLLYFNVGLSLLPQRNVLWLILFQLVANLLFRFISAVTTDDCFIIDRSTNSSKMLPQMSGLVIEPGNYSVFFCGFSWIIDWNKWLLDKHELSTEACKSYTNVPGEFFSSF